MIKEIYIETAFSKLAAKIWHEQQQNRLLALHGWMDNLTSFEDLLPLLNKYQSVAIDLPGHGFSQHRSMNTGYSFANWPLDVIACLEALSWEKCSILGHSLGASIACFVAALCPEKVEKLILIEGLGPITSENPLDTLKKHVSENFSFAKKKEPIYKNLDILIAKRSQSLPEKAAISLMERSMYRVPDGYKWRIDGRLRLTSPVRLSEEQVISVLSQIKCPVLLFKAENGLSYDKDKIERRCEAIANLEVVEVPGRHHAHMEYPDKIAAHIRKFE